MTQARVIHLPASGLLNLGSDRWGSSVAPKNYCASTPVFIYYSQVKTILLLTFTKGFLNYLLHGLFYKILSESLVFIR